MIKRTLAAFVILATTSVWAQTIDTTQTSPAETTTTAESPVAPEAEAQAPVVPTDPMQLAAYALENARQPAQCRFVFTRAVASNARVDWSGDQAEVVVHFDPRQPLGERWTVVQAVHQRRAIERSLQREDRKGFPTDLLMLTAEGEYTFENVAYVRELPDRNVYSFTPHVLRERAESETGTGILEQLVGEFEVSRETGRLLSSTFREPPEGAVRSLAIVRVHSALVRNNFAGGVDNLQTAESGSQMYQMSALGTQAATTMSYRYSDVEAICDPAEVARIQEAETAPRTPHRR